MGIGINTGIVVVGNIGSQKRSKYGVVGSQVYLAYRIESYTAGGQILISGSTLQAAVTILRIDEQREVEPKRFHQSIITYQIGNIGGEYNLFLPNKEAFLISSLSLNSKV